MCSYFVFLFKIELKRNEPDDDDSVTPAFPSTDVVGDVVIVDVCVGFLVVLDVNLELITGWRVAV